VSYFLRAFCRSAELPSPQEAVAFAASRGVNLRIADDEAGWPQFVIAGGADDRPLLVVEASSAGDPDSLFEDEIEEFLDLLDDAPTSTAARSVVDRLRQSRSIVALQIIGAEDEEAVAAASPLLTFFAERCDGQIQADGEGFYDGDKLIVPLE
jgi:hypothetical protein